MKDSIFLPEDNVNEKERIAAFDNSIDFYLLILKSFAKEAGKTIKQLPKYIEQEDSEHYRIAVHGLKSTAAAVGFQTLSDHARESEMCCKQSDWDGAKSKNQALLDEVDRALELIEQRIKEYEES